MPVKMKMEQLTDELALKAKKLTIGFQFISLAKEKTTDCILTKGYKSHAERIHNLDVREDDIWVVTFPRAGKWNIQQTNQNGHICLVGKREQVYSRS